MSSTNGVKKALSQLQQLIRRPPLQNGERAATSILIPPEFADGLSQQLNLLRGEVDAIEAVKNALLDDLCYEHLRKPDDDVRHFIIKCWADRKVDHIPAFIEQHRREPVDRVCFMPVEHLTVAKVTDVFGIRLLPLDDAELPQREPRMSLEKPIGSVAAVTVRGTNLGLMAERARFLALHALRVMRIALREDMGTLDWQLRFRLSQSYAFDDSSAGWKSREDAAFELGFEGTLIALAGSQPISRMPAHPTTDIDKKADLALQWMERAWLVGDPLVALLYLFFALEALLGDTSEGLKSHKLAFRQTMLSHIVDGNFSNPNETVFLYDRVRSGAVHGENAPDVDLKVVQGFAWAVRRTLNQYLTVSKDQHFFRRGRLLTFVKGHKDQQMLLGWLQKNGGPLWTKFLDDMEREMTPVKASSDSSQKN